MAWCENPHCGKQGLRKADVELDDSIKKVLCHGCYAHAHPGWVPPSEFVDLSNGTAQELAPPRFGFALQASDKEGIKAMLSYGGVSLALQASNEDLKRLFGN